jgi:hypothetical protein
MKLGNSPRSIGFVPSSGKRRFGNGFGFRFAFGGSFSCLQEI